jgi:dTDP-4-amino-4,6-dideoxygalactose transaminase
MITQDEQSCPSLAGGADMDRIMNITKQNGLFVLEDAAHAVGPFGMIKSGSIGHAGSFSFSRVK